MGNVKLQTVARGDEVKHEKLTDGYYIVITDSYLLIINLYSKHFNILSNSKIILYIL